MNQSEGVSNYESQCRKLFIIYFPPFKITIKTQKYILLSSKSLKAELWYRSMEMFMFSSSG